MFGSASAGMGECSQISVAFAPSLYLINHPGQLSLVIPPGGQNEYPQKLRKKAGKRCLVPVVTLVSGRGIQKMEIGFMANVAWEWSLLYYHAVDSPCRLVNSASMFVHAGVYAHK